MRAFFAAFFVVALWSTAPAMLCAREVAEESVSRSSGLLIGWGSVDITPDEPVLISGQFHARVSEGIMDPVTATALALESVENGRSQGRVVMVSCDLSTLAECLRDGVREHLRRDLPELDPKAVFFSATHTHSGPYTAVRPRYRPGAEVEEHPYGIELDVMSPADYVDFAARRIADAVIEAWNGRRPGGIAFGLGHAVVGRNRLIAYRDGSSRMYGNTDQADFSHVEGYEDHSVNVVATYDGDRKLTGVVVNLACPSQLSEHIHEISADFWHETREELGARLGEELFVLPQHGPAGDQASRVLWGRAAEERMWRLAGRTQREEVGVRIADAVTGVLALVEDEVDWNPTLVHRIATVELPRRQISEQDVRDALADAARAQEQFESMLRDLEANPEKKEERRWYRDITRSYRLSQRGARVAERFELQQTQPNLPIEVHVVRLGDVAFATNPFELYLDFGVQMKARSRAVQTFLVQLAGPGSYVPTERSVAGGAYGAVPASTEVGPEGGRILVDWTVEAINALFE